MRKISYLLILAVVAFSACTEPFKKAKDGTEYKIISGKGGKLVMPGNTMEMNAVVKYNDSLLYSSVEQGMPQFAPYDTANFPPLYKEIFKTIHVGDSIIIKLSTDSLMKSGPAAPWMQKGKFIVQTYKITNTYATQAEADKARQAAIPVAEAIAKKKTEELVKKDDKTLTDYFAKNNIKATKAPLGTYYEVIQAGAGPLVDTSNVVKVNYTGKTMAGVMFDSNTDPSKGPSEPLTVNFTNDPSLGMTVIAGWKDAITQMNKGTKAKLYIPSALAYGAQSPSELVPANSILVFDIEILDVLNKAEAKADVEIRTKKMQEMQQKYMDSIKKANPVPATK
ncbi:FKBP-type peptidyl-prolyl cis-trans isomerase [Ferruginibacter sp. HRS2-29]|uniref:FKBP-type peptidyl-prolyl cis-trans isomerase n=1 Tax=Ferruginibacter sp. HRS2-29 TaxID=2487334 RepID=UPI0020CF6253|nr:FKBP-type peptidyl-prolyl cis-trans isomerase [Ferruginibacter sp. HRS2-29]MCP9750072.1 hypothetical protein [Ferruginibacter sp. HRS2-29]